MYAENISAKSAIAIKSLSADTAWICIHDEYEPPHHITPKGNILQLTFSDVRAITTHKGIVYHPISISDAHKIIIFVQNNQAKKFIINCNAGISRSSAICQYIHNVYGHQLKPDFWTTSEPNPFVLGTLLIEHEKLTI